MDRSNLQELFSRGATPPQLQHPAYANQPRSHSSSPNHIDSLFHNLSAPSSVQLPGGAVGNTYSISAPGTPVSVSDDAISSSVSAPNNIATERQSALLSLLGTVSNPGSNARGNTGGPAAAPSLPQQVPTPPGSSQRSGPSPNNSESQGKFLLEQLMSGNAPRSNYADSQRSSLPGSVPSPPQSSGQREGEGYRNREASYDSQDTPRDLSQRNQPQQQPQPQPQQTQPPSPTSRKSMFDFISPFDAFPSSSSSSSVKKKPVPPAEPPSASSGNEESWTSVSLPTDPKRKSVENLMDQLTRGQGPPPAQEAPPSYDTYVAGEDVPQPEPVQSRALPQPPPLPPKPPRAVSPRASPPKTHAQHRPVPRSGESPVGQPAVPQMPQGSVGRRDKESSPGPRGNWKGPGQEGRGKGPGGKGKNQTSPSSQAQSIVFDVSQPLDEIQSPPESVKSTAIALVKQDSVFLPGTTIGVTQWVAYAMTKGRVRVISRLSGDRTLLQLPQSFPSTTAITDMAVFGNRLAGVTSDGGFVVWELPDVITDDVPGRLLLCVSPDPDGLHSVKWHPKQPDTLAVASETRIYLLDLTDAPRIFRGDSLPQSELGRIGPVFIVSSRLVAFDFDVPHYAIASISEDSTLALWNVHDKIPFWTHKVRGDDAPSSLTFVEDGIVVGRKNGTIFQLLSATTKSVLSTVKFINGNREDADMFGHINYDSRIQTLWVANSRRESVIAFKIGYENSVSPSGELVKGAFFDQVVEFAGPKPTIHFVILSADSDPNGDEAHAACVAAKITPGDLALVSFSVHSSGVDQILIRKEWFDKALAVTHVKFPPATLPQAPHAETKGHRQLPQVLTATIPVPQAPTPPGPSTVAPARLRTPPSEDIEVEITRDETRLTESKAKGGKGKNVIWKDKDDSGKEKDKNGKNSDAAIISDSSLGQALSREIRKSEESLHTRIGRLIGKEMDKQHLRLEEARAHEQAEDFTRQEKILKLISTELTRNTTRVVEMAVKSEVQNSVLPALENITKTEVKSALNDQIGRGLGDFIQQSLPIEIEKLLLRPDISNHFAHILSSNLTPLIERNVKEAVSKTFLPAYTQQSSALHQELVRELRSEVHNVKSELTSWQSEAFRGQEALIRDLEHSVRTLSDQVKFLTLNVGTAPAPVHHQLQQARGSPGTGGQHPSGNIAQPHLRQNVNQPPSSYNQGHGPFQQQPQPPPMHGPWFSSGIAAPQASHPLAPPPPPPPPIAQRTPPTQSEEWDDTYLAVLGTQDPRQLRELLNRSNPEVVMPLNGPGPLSQAVVLTLLHRLATVVGETPPVDESFKTSLWWLQRTASTLNTKDPLISPYIARVVPNVQQMLNTTKQRLAILPGGPQLLETTRTISDVQDTLSRKPL